MDKHTLTVELPGDIYERLSELALQSKRPIHAVLVEQLSQHIVDPFADVDGLESAMDAYSDPQLWAMADETANRLLHNPRLDELKPRNQAGLLTDQEKIELEHLVDKMHDLVLIRSKALALLQARGYDIHTYLQLTTY